MLQLTSFSKKENANELQLRPSLNGAGLPSALCLRSAAQVVGR